MTDKYLPESVLPATPLVEVRRGRIVESRHRGHVIAVDGVGRLVAQTGDPSTVTFLRSSAKPFQAIPLITSGAADRFGFSEREIAAACASHNGEPIHVSAVASILEKIGLDEDALRCGVHEPFGREAANTLARQGLKPTPIHNNCSGKHAAMLALALHLGAAPEEYDQLEKPVQQVILDVVAMFAGLHRDEVEIGTDGCGVPVFGMSVQQMALMYARLVNPPDDFDEGVRRACRRIVAAMLSYPQIIGGETNRLDTEIMRANPGRVVSKVGAEGVYTLGVLPGGAWPQGLGFALKIEDGEDRRARPVAVIESLRQLGLLDADAIAHLSPYARFDIRNHRGNLVGEVAASFQLRSE